ncbi:hepatocyte growth factor receptor-like [Dermacentor variabilis]|uniref:hepatocyte growth factor receptor-like n=1 Tax=Dermacentor variabilis TaxID=34621 RepID=UPI003F5C2072
MDQRNNYGGQLPAVVLLTLTLGTVVEAQAALSIKTFQLPRGPAQKLLYVNLSRGDGVVVVGGRNALYALSPDLSLRALYRTGPENDSALCPPHPLPCEHSRNVTDNYNRILLQIGTEPLILACGATSQGMCSIHDPLLSPNVTTLMDKNLTDNYVASKKSTVAFFGTGDDGGKVLFTASAPDGRPPEYRLFTVAARVLSTSGSFRLLSHTRATSADESDRLKAAQTLRFVYGFSHNAFAYFVVVQKVEKAFQSSFETRLARVCDNDESSFRTYVEVPIMCPPADGALSAATSAYLWPSKSASGGGSGGNGSTDFLAVAFGGVPAGRLNTSYLRLSSSSSVVCFFDMKSVEDTFRKTVENCDNGWGSARLSPLYHDDGDDLKCSHHDTESKNVCTPGRNDYVESTIPLVGRAPITLKNSLATSVTVMEQNGSTVVWVGNDKGFLRKLLLQDDSTRLLASLDLSKVGRMIYRSTALDSNGTYGYFIIDNKVIRFPVGSCNIYGSCSQCIHNQEDPLQCGWCGDHCAHFAECPYRENFSVDRCPIEVKWKELAKKGPCSYQRLPDASREMNATAEQQMLAVQPAGSDHFKPSATTDAHLETNSPKRVHPLNGPVSGGTLLTILGDNFGSPERKLYSSIRIIIGNHICDILYWDPKRQVCRVLGGGRKMLCPGTSLLQFSVITEAELRNHRFRVPAFISFRMGGLYLPPNGLGRGAYFMFHYLPASEPDSYTEQEASANVPLASSRTDNATFGGVKPWYGPAAGGTNITLFGTNLDTGTERSVIIGGANCTIYRINSTSLECSTNAVANESHLDQEMQIILTIDGTDVPFIPKENLSSKFTYKPDPIIDDITPRRSTFSGNFSLEVTGAHLDSVAQPAIVTRVTSLNQEQKVNIRQECRVVEGGFKMQCPGTSLMESSVISPSELKGLNDSVLVWISFQMDGLHLPQAIDGANGHFPFVYQPEPQFMFSQVERGVNPSEVAVEITVVYAGQSYPVGAVKLMTAEQPDAQDGIIAGSTMAAVLAAVATGVGFLLHRRRRQRVKGTWQTSYVVRFGQRHNKSDSLANASNRYFREGNVDAQQALMATPFDVDEETRTMLQRENLLIDRGWLHLGRVIGQGHFGCVYHGTIKQEDKGQVQDVAVKTLHNNSRGGEVDSTAFLEEALIMKDFHHVNVLPLIGLSIDKADGLMVIIPFMKYGDLLSYIRDDRNAPTVKQLITFGLHVAEGMKYLACTKFVHRDLAARNCMLSEDFIVRVADFGLSRDVYEKDYYSGDNKKTKLPVKWMAPESLEKGIYTHKSDVWSYGVLLWELITRGVTPYSEVDNWDIVDFLKQGRRMKQPSFCPDELYDIMLQCWQEDPKKRPSFAKLATEIPNLVTRLEKKKRNKRLGLNVTYINCPRPQPADEAGSSTESIPI